MQESFVKQNKFIRPHIMRKFTNRPNIRYIVRREKKAGLLKERAARLVRLRRDRTDLFRYGRERIILYCRIKEFVAEFADLLNCPSYTADSGTDEKKDVIIA